MITDTATITNKGRETNRLLVLTDGDLLLFVVQVPWYEFDNYTIGQKVEVCYLLDDQFAQLVKEAHVT